MHPPGKWRGAIWIGSYRLGLQLLLGLTRSFIVFIGLKIRNLIPASLETIVFEAIANPFPPARSLYRSLEVPDLLHEKIHDPLYTLG
ncbi:hypothetical protein A3197_21515 [Candidatus Thiodiazotropha endoloripes]|nr:hypothetical protein A3197_21515 [Candidatus Thiodiazotropha endoloripes]